MRKPAHLSLDLLVRVELDLVVDLDHHRFYLLQLVTNVRKVLLLLQLKKRQIRTISALHTPLLLYSHALLPHDFGQLLGCSDSRARLFS